jgi:hypothetical protein
MWKPSWPPIDVSWTLPAHPNAEEFLKRRTLVIAGALLFLFIGRMAGAADYVVDQTNKSANDANDGSADHPFKTISAAVVKMREGDTITVHRGLYRESFSVDVSGSPQHPAIVRAAPGEDVVITGADPVTGWQKSDAFGDKPIYVKKNFVAWSTFGGHVAGRDAKPQLIIDDVLMLHVENPDAMHPGTFCYDPKDGGTIYLWMTPPVTGERKFRPGSQWWENPTNLASADPNDHHVEASVRPWNIRVSPLCHDVSISGFIVRYDCGGFPTGTAIELGAGDGEGDVNNVTLENCVVEFTCGGALNALGSHITIRGCYFRHTGTSSGVLLADSIMENCVFDANSNRGIEHGWSAGGIKFLRTARTIVRQCQFINNDGPGIWFDWGNSDNIVERNLCVNNYGPGIMMEVSPHFDSVTNPNAHAVMDPMPEKRLGLKDPQPAGANILRNNICVANRWDGTVGCGILLQMASNTQVLNNTVCGNEKFGIFVRYHPYDGAGHRCVNDVILNNICVDNGGSQIYITQNPADKPGFVADNRSDFNLLFSHEAWHRPGTLSELTRPDWLDASNFGRWGKTEFDGTYSAEEWNKISGYDAHSIQADPMFTSPATLDYSLLRSSSAIGSGTKTALVTEDFYGRPRPADRPPSIGAVEFFEDRPTPPQFPSRGAAFGVTGSSDRQ